MIHTGIGHELWEEARIPLFEQSVAATAFYDRERHLVERVTFGTRYLEHSVMELFRQNDEAFPVLLPAVTLDETRRLAHLRRHNGTIWRWNRLLIDFDGQERPTLRLEYRFTQPHEVLEVALSRLWPTATLECGLSRSAKGVTRVERLIGELMGDYELDNAAPEVPFHLLPMPSHGARCEDARQGRWPAEHRSPRLPVDCSPTDLPVARDQNSSPSAKPPSK